MSSGEASASGLTLCGVAGGGVKSIKCSSISSGACDRIARSVYSQPACTQVGSCFLLSVAGCNVRPGCKARGFFSPVCVKGWTIVIGIFLGYRGVFILEIYGGGGVILAGLRWSFWKMRGVVGD